MPSDPAGTLDPGIRSPASHHRASQAKCPAVPRLLRSSTLYFAGNVASRAVSFLMLPF